MSASGAAGGVESGHIPSGWIVDGLYDNALAESFVESFTSELIADRS